jgi:hypothetical protein
MTDQNGNRDGQRENGQPGTIIVPGTVRRVEDLSDEELMTEVQQARDLGSASRSCVAIFAGLGLLALLLCVFLMWAFFIR